MKFINLQGILAYIINALLEPENIKNIFFSPYYRSSDRKSQMLSNVAFIPGSNMAFTKIAICCAALIIVSQSVWETSEGCLS